MAAFLRTSSEIRNTGTAGSRFASVGTTFSDAFSVGADETFAGCAGVTLFSVGFSEASAVFTEGLVAIDETATPDAFSVGADETFAGCDGVTLFSIGFSEASAVFTGGLAATDGVATLVFEVAGP